MYAHTTHSYTHAHMHAHTHTHTHRVLCQGNGTEQKVFKKTKIPKEVFKELTDRMMDRNRELVSL